VRAASANDVPPGFEAAAAAVIASKFRGLLVQLIWEDSGEDSGYVRSDTLTVLRARSAPVYRPRVQNLDELRENVVSRQQQRHPRTTKQAVKQAESARSRRAGSTRKPRQAVDASRLEKARDGGAPPWWLERASLPCELLLPPLQDRSASAGGGTGRSGRKRRQGRPHSRARQEPAVVFRPRTPVQERLTALKEHALTKKVAQQGSDPADSWVKTLPTALVRHYIVHGETTATLDRTRARTNDDDGESGSEGSEGSVSDLD
jgi:hypothetical protein